MSRLGKLPIILPAGTQGRIEDGFLYVKGPKGELKQKLIKEVKVEISEEDIRVSIVNLQNKNEKALWGLYWSLIGNMVKGVTVGYEKKLEIIGVGFRVSLAGQKLLLNLGFSHQVEFPLPAGITAIVVANTITIIGIDKQLVGETAARLRKIKKPEPYKGKGIKYSDEIVRRKEGKTAGKGEK